MMLNTFFVCPNGGNDKEFKFFTRNFRVTRQSPEIGVRIEESDVLPNLRQSDNYIECQLCFKKFEYNNAATIGKKYIQATQKLRKTKYFSLGQDSQNFK